jgi:SAM-dependent methyltransferase
MGKEGGMLSKIINLGRKLLPCVLFVLEAPVRRELNKEVKTILDAGCGQGLAARSITRSKKFFTVGAESFLPDLRVAKKNGTHDDFVLCDARSLPFQRKSFDVVLCIEMLEHVDKEEGLRLLKDMEEIAVRKVILSTPVGFLHTSLETSPCHRDDSNPYQEHRAGWKANELSALGYKVYWNDYLHKIEEFLNNRHRTWSWMLSIIIFSLAGHLLWISPKFGSHLFCVKELNTPGKYVHLTS